MQVKSIAECSLAILLTFIKLPFVIKIFVLSIFESSFHTDFTEQYFLSLLQQRQFSLPNSSPPKGIILRNEASPISVSPSNEFITPITTTINTAGHWLTGKSNIIATNSAIKSFVKETTSQVYTNRMSSQWNQAAAKTPQHPASHWTPQLTPISWTPQLPASSWTPQDIPVSASYSAPVTTQSGQVNAISRAIPVTTCSSPPTVQVTPSSIAPHTTQVTASSIAPHTTQITGSSSAPHHLAPGTPGPIKFSINRQPFTPPSTSTVLKVSVLHG